MTEIKVMCDYCADGLWEDGYAIDIDMLVEDYDIPEELIKDLRPKIEEWQDLYESFEFYDPDVSDEEIKSREEYKKFMKLGPEIAYEVRHILPTSIRVIYFDEDNSKEYIVELDGTMKLFERKRND